MTTSQIAKPLSLSARMAAGLVAFLFGSALLYGDGLAKDARMHNAAHDTRHAIGFPCH